MKYDFTTIMDRHGKDAGAVDALGVWPMAPLPPKEGFDFIPMWVADMNFPTAPSITDAMMERIQHPAFGYYSPTKEYFDAIIRWQVTHNGVEGLEEKHIGYENGVLGGVASALRCYAEPGDSILVHSPTYIGFTGTLKANGYNIVHSQLKQDENSIYRMDFEDMEEKIQKHNISVAIFCNPHNPTGRAWERWEMEEAARIYEKYNVTVISDEIWSDLLLGDHKHIPFQSINDYTRNHTAAFYAPSKTFNLAGLVGSYHIIYNDQMRNRIVSHAQRTHYNDMNVLSMHALIGAYSETGEEWLRELRQVLTENVEYACNFINTKLQGISVTKPEATYMLFLDCEEWCRIHGVGVEELLHAGWEVGVGWQDGVMFNGPTHIRMNLALPLSRVKEALERLKKNVVYTYPIAPPEY